MPAYCVDDTPVVVVVVVVMVVLDWVVECDVMRKEVKEPSTRGPGSVVGGRGTPAMPSAQQQYTGYTVLEIMKNIYRCDGQVTLELYRSCQMFTGLASQAAFTKYCLAQWIWKLFYYGIKETIA